MISRLSLWSPRQPLHKGATVRPDLFQYPLWRSR